MFLQLHIFLYLVILSCLLVIDAEECTFLKLQDPDFYDTDITITQIYKFPIICEGYVKKYHFHAFGTGRFYIYFYVRTHTNAINPVAVSLDVKFPGTHTVEEATDIYVASNTEIGIIYDKTGPVLRDHLEETEYDEVLEYPGIYFSGDEQVVDLNNLTYSKYRKTPSIEVMIEEKVFQISNEFYENVDYNDATTQNTESDTTEKDDTRATKQTLVSGSTLNISNSESSEMTTEEEYSYELYTDASETSLAISIRFKPLLIILLLIL